MVIRTTGHNAKISAGMKRFHQKVRTGLGGDKYEKLIGPAAKYRQFKNAGIKTKFQTQQIRKKSDKAKKREKREAKAKKKKKPKFDSKKPPAFLSARRESSEESNFLLDAIDAIDFD